MISPGWVQMMARYNAWQNHHVRACMSQLDDDSLRADRGAFFGSIFRTANHLVWGDLNWVSRFDGGPGPSVAAAQHDAITQSFSEWRDLRDTVDQRLTQWSESVSQDELDGELTWYAAMLDAYMTKPMAHCVTHLFNHQTHHRGQLHAMLTAAGVKTADTDLILMPFDST